MTLQTKGLAWQRKILSAVALHGHIDGWRPEAFIARQAVKLLEQACCLFLAFSWPNEPEFNRLREYAVTLKQHARWAFEDEALWHRSGVADQIIKWPGILSGCAHCTIALANIAEMQREITACGFALLVEAATRAESGDEHGD